MTRVPGRENRNAFIESIRRDAHVSGASTKVVMSAVKISGVAFCARRDGMRSAKRLYRGQLAIAVTDATRTASKELFRTHADSTTITAAQPRSILSLMFGPSVGHIGSAF